MKIIKLVIILFTILIQVSCRNNLEENVFCVVKDLQIHYNDGDIIRCPNYDSKTLVFLTILFENNTSKLIVFNHQKKGELKNTNVSLEFNDKLLKMNNNRIAKSLFAAETFLYKVGNDTIHPFNLYKVENDTIHPFKKCLITIKINKVFGKSLENMAQRFSFLYQEDYGIDFKMIYQYNKKVIVKGNKNIQIKYYKNGENIKKNSNIIKENIIYFVIPPNALSRIEN